MNLLLMLMEKKEYRLVKRIMIFYKIYVGKKVKLEMKITTKKIFLPLLLIIIKRS